MQASDAFNSFEHFIDRYGPSIYSTIARLTGLSGSKDLEILSVEVLVYVWKNNEELSKEQRPSIYIYKTVVQHVFAWLKKEGKDELILKLKNTLLIDPVNYAHVLEPEK